MVKLSVYVQPRAVADEVVSYSDGVLKVRVKAPPVGGQANAAVQALLADFFGLSKGQVKLVAGHTGRRKLVALQSVTAERIQEQLARLSGKPR